MANLKQAAAKVAERIGLPGLVKQAKTAADYDVVLADLDEQIRAAREEFADLESKRSTFILEGGDVETYHARVLSLRERLSLLEASRVEAQRRRDAAARGEAKEAPEALMARIKAKHLEGYERALNDHHVAGKAFVESGERLKEHEKAIDSANYEAKAAGREDLVLSIDSVRSRVRETLFDSSSIPPAPTWAGPLPRDVAKKLRSYANTQADQKARAAYIAWLERHGYAGAENLLKQTETEAGFQLRCQIHAQMISSAIRREDPLKVVADAIYKTLDEVTVPRAVGDVRSNRRVDFRTFKTPDGQVIERRLPVDGRGSARPMQLTGG